VPIFMKSSDYKQPISSKNVQIIIIIIKIIIVFVQQNSRRAGIDVLWEITFFEDNIL